MMLLSERTGLDQNLPVGMFTRSIFDVIVLLFRLFVSMQTTIVLHRWVESKALGDVSTCAATASAEVK